VRHLLDRKMHPRGSMSLVNIAWASTLTWGNPTLKRLEEQAKVPLFGTNLVELGLKPGAAAFLKLASGDARYKQLFRRAFPKNADPFKSKI